MSAGSVPKKQPVRKTTGKLNKPGPTFLPYQKQPFGIPFYGYGVPGIEG